MKLIVAVDQNWGIGRDNQLLVHISEDLKFFKRTTMGHPVVMGRKTLESFPGGRPLPGRKNLVLTRDASFQKEGVTLVHSVEELFEELKELSEEPFVIGGDSVYRQLLDFCDTAYVTRIDKGFDADAFFPNLDERADWRLSDTSEVQKQDDFTYRWVTYEKVRV